MTFDNFINLGNTPIILMKFKIQVMIFSQALLLWFLKKIKKKVMIFMILRLLCNFEGLMVGKYNFRKVCG